jgi:predicted RNase H-like HicB family nuclease
MSGEMETLEYYLAIPYIVRLESVRTEDGRWTRRASHPELEACLAEADGPEEALDLLAARKRAWIESALARGSDIPVPRAPLNEGMFALRRARQP